MKKNSIINLVLFTVFSMGFISCGSTNFKSQDYNEWNGIFVDTFVSGLHWKCGKKEGLTKNGFFGSCAKNSFVRFSIGGIVLGESYMLEDYIFTPHNLVSGSNRDMLNNSTQNNDEILKIASLLLSLDKDGNSFNGIEITAEIEEALENSFSLLLPSLEKKHIKNISQEDIETIVKIISLELNKDKKNSLIYTNIVNASIHLLSTVLDINAGRIIGPLQPDKIGGAEG